MGWFDNTTDVQLAALAKGIADIQVQLADVKKRLVVVTGLLKQVLTQEAVIMDELNKILDQAEANAAKETDATVAIEDLITVLAKQVADLKNTAPQIPAATLARIQALSDGMAARAAQMASKAVEGTPHA